MTSTELHYITDPEGNPTGVIVPIDVWHEIASERETAYLLRSATMRRRLAEARSRRQGLPLEDVLAKHGL
jgi:PHD/YefM family antitoxin component YafN of YafNO toxin-antitoxin module